MCNFNLGFRKIVLHKRQKNVLISLVTTKFSERDSVGLLSQTEKWLLNSCDGHFFYMSHAVVCVLRTAAIPVTVRI
jgi:hypothetical protein